LENNQLTNMEHYGVRKTNKKNDLFGEYTTHNLGSKDFLQKSLDSNPFST
jgi:hypothetical protein